MKAIRGFSKIYLLIAGTVVLVLVVAAGTYMLGRMSVYSSHPELTRADEATKVLQKVSTLIQLPQNELPTIATISDAEALKLSQPFLKDAENEDVLIVYELSRMAVLYRPSTHLLIAVGPVDLGTPAVEEIEVPANDVTATSTEE